MKHPLPESALESDIAILGRKGGGKTVTAKGIVERLIRMGHRVLIFDPLGGWWGLKSSADGAAPGLKVAVFGGEHADVPIVPELAVPLADILARENVPAILDIADMKQELQRKFLLAFLGELRRVNRDPLTIVLEEADVFAPQNPTSDLARELHGEIDWLARRGRARGFRLITVCQRPARLAKDVLTQATTLIAHVLPSPQDRDAVKAWVEGNGDKDAAKQVFETLGKLHVGEAWTWFADPQHGFLRRVHYPMIKTFDSTKTPKAGEKRIEAKELADVDMTSIRAALEGEKKAQKTGADGVSIPLEVAAARAEAYEAEYQRGYREGHERGREDAETREAANLAAASLLETNLEEASKYISVCLGYTKSILNSAPSATPSREPAEPASDHPSHGGLKTGRGPKPARKAKTDNGAGAFAEQIQTGTSAPMAKIVDAIAWWNALGISTPTQIQVAHHAAYSPKSGTWRTYMSRMKTAGLVTIANKTIKLTPAGAKMAAPILEPPTFREARARIRAQLGEPLQKIVDHLIEIYPAGATRAQIARAAGYAESGSFRTYMSRVTSLGLITKEGDGRVKAARFMFGREPADG